MGDIPTEDEAREAAEAAMVAALGMTRSRQRAEELVQSAFEAVMTTRPWARSERSLARHLAGVVWSLASHEHTSQRPKMEAAAHRGWHREELGVTAASPEDKTLHRAEEETRQADAEAELEALEASLAGNDLARSVLRCRRENDAVKAADIAAKLDVPVEQVYRANEFLRDHLRTIRKKRMKVEADECPSAAQKTS
jgi:DNA-directed RNA polymerase specialized sigma24 family protein